MSIRKHGPAIETRQSHTIEYRVSKIVPDGHGEGNKSPAILRGSAARRRIGIPMCNQSTTCNPHWHIRSRLSTIKRVIGLHMILYSILNTVTDRR